VFFLVQVKKEQSWAALKIAYLVGPYFATDKKYVLYRMSVCVV